MAREDLTCDLWNSQMDSCHRSSYESSSGFLASQDNQEVMLLAGLTDVTLDEDEDEDES